LLDLVLG